MELAASCMLTAESNTAQSRDRSWLCIFVATDITVQYSLLRHSRYEVEFPLKDDTIAKPRWNRSFLPQADQSDAYYYLHKRLDDNYDVISALERQLLVEDADRGKVEQEYGRQIDVLEHRMDEELTPLKEKIIAVEEQASARPAKSFESSI